MLFLKTPIFNFQFYQICMYSGWRKEKHSMFYQSHLPTPELVIDISLVCSILPDQGQ